MRQTRLISIVRRMGVAGISFLPISLPTFDCLGNDIAKRFREITGPAFVEGINIAVLDPESAEYGFRQAGAAIIEGLGGIIDTRTPSSINGDTP